MNRTTKAVTLEDSITGTELKPSPFQLSQLVEPTNIVAPLEIILNFTSSLTSSQQEAFENAEQTWESLIIGYQEGISIASLTIDASVELIDGSGGVLGQAGPTDVSSQNNLVLSTKGIMQFDSADVTKLENDGLFEDVILHEMAHVIGFGTLWNTVQYGFTGTQELYIDGSGEFTGINAANAYEQEFNDNNNTSGTVPVEEGGGSGTQGGHWNEVNGGSGLTGITNDQGQDFRNELMTGWLNPPFSFISNTTIQSFADIGYVVANSNNPPVITSSNFTIEENQSEVGTIQATDSDGDSLIYNITGGLDSHLFQIDTNTGLLTFITAPDFENPTDSNTDNLYQVEVTANDGSLNSQPAIIDVNVIDVDETQPSVDNPLNVSVNGEDVEGKVIPYSNQDNLHSSVSYTDGGNGVQIDGNGWKQIEIDSYTITQDTLLKFEFQSNSEGEIHGIGVDIDDNYRNSNEKIFQLYGTQSYGNQTYDDYQDGEGWKEYTISFGSFTGNIDSITLISDNDIANPLNISQFRNISLFESNGLPNQAPVITSTNFTIEENQSEVGTIQATDSDGDSLIYNITGGVDSNLFQINSNNGFLSFNTAPDYEIPVDSNTDNLYQVEVTANDGSLNSQPAVIDVNVTNVDETQPSVDSLLNVSVNGEDVEGEVIPYSSNQDNLHSSVSYTDGGNGVQIDGNGWKQIEIGNYTITQDTLLKFEFQSNSEGEIHGIGVDIDDNYRNSNEKIFQLYGTQGYGNQTYNDYKGGEGWKEYIISFGSFTGAINSITFISDNDIANPLNISQFRNIALFEPLG